MAEDRFLLDSPAIEKAVAFHNSADYPPRRPGKNFLDDVPAVGGGGGYDGMFAVTDNGDGTVTIKGGYAKTAFHGFGWLVPDSTLNLSGDCYIAIVATLDDPENHTVTISFAPHQERGSNELYIPGKQMAVDIAAYRTGVAPSIVQLWQGGAIDFSLWYYTV